MADPRRHTVPLPGEKPRRAAFDALSLSINDIIAVSNVTDRAQLVAALTAAGAAPAPDRPLYVHRQDAIDAARLESTVDGTTWITHLAPPPLPAPKVAPGTPGSTRNNGTPTAAGNLIRDDVLGAYTFTALAGYQYRIVCDGVLLNGSAVGDVFSIQLRIAAGTDAPGGSATAVAATQATIAVTGSAGRQPIDLGGPWTCPATGVYSAAFFMQLSQGTGFGTPVSAVANRSLYAVLEHQVAS